MGIVLCIECEEEFAIARKRLGYNTCLECGEAQARQVIHCTVPMPKSSYVVITNKADLLHLNQKTRQSVTNQIKEKPNEPTKDNSTKPCIKLYTD